MSPFSGSRNSSLLLNVSLISSREVVVEPVLNEKPLEEKLDKIIERDENKRKLTRVVTEIRASNGDIADKFDELIYNWNNL